MNNSSKNRILFIVGVGRSGTSLIQSMIACHSKIHFLPETSFFRRYVLSRTLDNGPSPSDNQAIVNELEQDDKLRRLGLSFDGFEEYGGRGVSPTQRSGRRIDLSVYQWILGRIQSTYVADKDPKTIESLDVLLHLWPDCRVLHIYRDPRDVLVSKRKASWSKSKGTASQLVASAVQFSLGRKFEKQYGSQTIKSIQYEKLLSQPEDILEEICNWLELDYEQQMLDFGEMASKLVSNEELQWKSETLGPLLRNNSSKWKTELSPFVSRLTESCCSDVISYGNYSRDGRPGLVTKIAADICGLVIRAGAWAYSHWQIRKNNTVIRYYTPR